MPGHVVQALARPLHGDVGLKVAKCVGDSNELSMNVRVALDRLGIALHVALDAIDDRQER